MRWRLIVFACALVAASIGLLGDPGFTLRVHASEPVEPSLRCEGEQRRGVDVERIDGGYVLRGLGCLPSACEVETTSDAGRLVAKVSDGCRDSQWKCGRASCNDAVLELRARP